MWAYIKQIFTWVLRAWSALPDKTKKKIIDTTVDTMTDVFRAFYRSKDKKEAPKDMEPAHG